MNHSIFRCYKSKESFNFTRFCNIENLTGSNLFFNKKVDVLIFWKHRPPSSQQVVNLQKNATNWPGGDLTIYKNFKKIPQEKSEGKQSADIIGDFLLEAFNPWKK